MFTKITILSNENTISDQVHFTRESFDDVVNWLREGSRSLQFYPDTMTAIVKHEIRGQHGWETFTVVVNG